MADVNFHVNRGRPTSGTDSFSSVDTGVKAIDASRECLSFVLGRLFHPQVICARPGGACSRIEDTVRFLARNLEREEHLMTETGYPGFAAHKRQHRKLLENLDGMKRRLVCGEYDNALVADFLSEWTNDHTIAFDKPFGDFLRENGVESVNGGFS